MYCTVPVLRKVLKEFLLWCEGHLKFRRKRITALYFFVKVLGRDVSVHIGNADIGTGRQHQLATNPTVVRIVDSVCQHVQGRLLSHLGVVRLIDVGTTANESSDGTGVAPKASNVQRGLANLCITMPDTMQKRKTTHIQTQPAAGKSERGKRREK